MTKRDEITLCDSLITFANYNDDIWTTTGAAVQPELVRWNYIGGTQGCAAIPIQIPKEEQHITVFTDKDILTSAVDLIKSKYKIAYINECKEIHPFIYKFISQVEDKFDFILTHNRDLLKRGKKYVKYIGPGTTWIKNEDAKVYKKSKLLSHIASKQNWAQGHKLRHVISKCIEGKYEVDLWGSAHKAFKKEEKYAPLKDYHFSITVMNANHYNYFTETLVDTFRCGTVPIFWGCKNIEDFFNTKGMLIFNTPAELKNILDNLSIKTYEQMLPYVKENFETAKLYSHWDDTLYKIISKEIRERYNE